MRLGVVLVFGSLAGCQPAPAVIDPISPAQDLRQTPALPQQPVLSTEPAASPPPHRWGMNDRGEELMYAPANSDDIHIQMKCASRGKLRVYAFNPYEKGAQLHLASGKEAETFPAKGVPGDGELLSVDQYSSEITVSTSNHVMSEFRATGQLSRETPGDAPDLLNAKTLDELATIEKFFADCEGESS